MPSVRTRLISGALLLVAAVLAGAFQLSPLVASAASSYPRGSVDGPAEGATISGSVNVSGFAIDHAATVGTGVDHVHVYVDGIFRGEALYGRSRPDIGAYGARFVPSGFLFVLDTSVIGGGPHVIDARAHSTISGAWTSYKRNVIAPGPVATATPVGQSTPTPVPTPAPPTATPVPAPPKTFPKEFGINSHLTWYDTAQATLDTERARTGGLESVRFDVQWDRLEPNAKGGWNTPYLTQVDEALSAVTSRGLRPLLVVIGTPAWARGGAGTRVTPPTKVEDYADTLAFLAQRYASKSGLAIEVWNEPNQVSFWNTPSGPDPLVYARMLKAAYARIKAVAPAVTVVGGSIAYNDPFYLQSLYAFGGIAGSYDAISLHPYAGANAPDATSDSYRSFKLAIEETIKTMGQYGASDKPIWITEMGWSTNNVSESLRTTYLRRAVEMARAWPQVAQFQVYNQNQTDDRPDMGMFTTEGAPTASWAAYSLAVSVPNSTHSVPVGSVDSPSDWTEVMAVDAMTIAGWAIDLGSTSGTGVDRVQLFVDDKYVADATYGSARPDLGSAFGSRFSGSGYAIQLPLAGIAPGVHTLDLRAHNTVTGATTSYVRGLKVLKVPTAPSGYIDGPKENATVKGAVTVTGFAVDTGAASGTGVDRVQIFVDGVYRADAAYGRVRSDIAGAYGTRFGPSGFDYRLDLSGLTPGSHAIEVRARSSLSHLDTAYRRSVTVAP